MEFIPYYYNDSQKVYSPAELMELIVESNLTIGVACRIGNAELTWHMVQAGHGAYPDCRNWWPIHEAANGLHLECCKVLIESGRCNVNARTHENITPLMLVCRLTNCNVKATQFAKYLLDNGADPNIRTLDEMTPLIQSIKSSNTVLAHLLIDRGADPFATWYDGWTALHEAANSHDLEMMKRLIGLGADLFATDRNKHTPLFVAVQEHFVKGVKLLLKMAGSRAAELANMRIESGLSTVMVCANEGFDDILQLLINYGADCNLPLRPEWGDSNSRIHPLAAAALNNYYRCVKLLLPNVDKEAVLETDMDPMSAAAFRGSYDSLCLLLEAGYSTEVPMVSSEQDTIIIPYLRPLFCRRYYTPLREAVRKGHTFTVAKLLKEGAKMTYDEEYFSPFLFAFRNRIDPSILRLFVERNVDLNSMSKERFCDVPDALISALGAHNRRQLLLLLRCGLNPSLKNWCKCKNGYSLLYDVMQTTYVVDAPNLMKLLVYFSPGIPNCCNEVAEIVGARPEVPRLQHLCRLAVRSLYQPSQLLENRFLKKLRLPKVIKNYLAFEPIPKDILSE